MIELTFTYQKSKVIQALRYHFLSRKEIRILVIALNVFAILSAGLFYWKKILPIAFLSSSLLWFILMLTIWYLLPMTVYRKNKTFKDRFKISFEDTRICIESTNGCRYWDYSDFSYFLETVHFFHLYLNEKSFFLFPKDGLNDADQSHLLRQTLRQRIGQHVRGKRQ